MEEWDQEWKEVPRLRAGRFLNPTDSPRGRFNRPPDRSWNTSPRTADTLQPHFPWSQGQQSKGLLFSDRMVYSLEAVENRAEATAPVQEGGSLRICPWVEFN